MTVWEFLTLFESQHPAVLDYEIRDDGDIDPIPDYYIAEVVIDHDTQRVYLIWGDTDKGD